MNTPQQIRLSLALGSLFACSGLAQQQARPDSASAAIARFTFDGNTANAGNESISGSPSNSAVFARGIEGRALRLRSGNAAATFTIPSADLPTDPSQDFSVQFWTRTTAPAGERMVLLSQKHYQDNSLAAQKQPGWVFYLSDGTWAWNIGSGTRRLTYERDNGEHMPLNDGAWHQLTMTYDADVSQVRLYYDGSNKAIYNVADATGFDFAASQPLQAGWAETEAHPLPEIVPAIAAGAATLQKLVDAFNSFALDPVTPDEFVKLIVEPKILFEKKVAARGKQLGSDGKKFVASMRGADFQRVSRIESQLMRNPYTIHQAFSFMEAAPLLKLYALVDGKVTTDKRVAKIFSDRERLHPSNFDLDDLAVWQRVLPAEEVRRSYAAHFEPVESVEGKPRAKLDSLTTGVWNIFHGGKHFTVDEHGWDSRVAIAQIIAREQIDVVMMQETYSSGDFLAAELGYYFATTVDWDYLNQGANISVLSRYPIREVCVPGASAFMNVAARISISDTQDVWVMSNWYGMNQFDNVFAFHRSRFAEAATTPVFFGGDFNAIPHTDGGSSPASEAMQKAGFTDAYRSLFPDVSKFPGASHRSNRRIDQLYFQGAGVQHRSTKLINSWTKDFPSDHYLIRSQFALR